MRALRFLRNLAPLSFALRLGALGCSDTNPAENAREGVPAPAPEPVEVFALTGGVVTGRTNRILPVRISTATHGNDFRPVFLDGDEEARVRARIAAFSASLPQTHDARARVLAARSGPSAL